MSLDKPASTHQVQRFGFKPILVIHKTWVR